jgi:hypothetical protein
MKTIILQELIGKTFESVKNINNKIIFNSVDRNYCLKHSQLCCSEAWVEDITGYLSDLENNPIIKAEQRMDITYDSEANDYIYWTFYEIAANKGSVTIRFCAPNNDYSVSVDLFEVLDDTMHRIDSYDDIKDDINDELWEIILN